MKSYYLKPLVVVLGATTLAAAASGVAAAPTPSFDWQVVVNNGFAIPDAVDPDTGARFYNSYNPPSVNSDALVVFRARSTGQSRGPVSGIYTRDMATEAPIEVVADRKPASLGSSTQVPDPNNTLYPVPGGSGEQKLSTFNEFPSFPRIAITADAVATRGVHEPVWTYVIGEDPDTQEPIETRVGTTGVYVNLDANNTASPLVTGASLLGAVVPFGETLVPGVNYFPYYAVPGVEPATRFDVFPGAPAITDAGVIATKGNYSVDDPASEDPEVTIGKTGVFYRAVTPESTGGLAAVELVANSDTLVPNPGACPPDTTFGSTAPPSAADDQMVFVGFDNEDDPTCGGVYLAPLAPSPELTTLVGLETSVPGQGNETFTQLGEGLSYDGRFVGFWGAWGETKTVRLYCPAEGNRDRRDYCNNVGEFDPDTGTSPGDPNSICDDVTDPKYPDVCYQEKEVPVNQGIFVYDTTGNGKLRLVARTGVDADFDDFVFWNYSGAPPGAGESEGEAEPPRWRSSAFQAVSQRAGATFRIAFLARNGDIDANNLYVNPVDGIYLGEVLGASSPTLTTLVQTGMDGTFLDPEAVWDDDEDPTTPDVPLPIASLALEREAFRAGWLAITASMGVEEAGWAGIYLTQMPVPPGRGK